jgi:hypothetical protein
MRPVPILHLEVLNGISHRGSRKVRGGASPELSGLPDCRSRAIGSEFSRNGQKIRANSHQGIAGKRVAMAVPHDFKRSVVE